MKMNAGRCEQVAGRKKITTQLINRVVIVFFMVEIRRGFVYNGPVNSDQY